MIMTMIMSPIKAELISIRCSILDTKYHLQNFTLLNTYTFFRWTCHGDSGGPSIARQFVNGVYRYTYTLLGVVSGGPDPLQCT